MTAAPAEHVEPNALTWALWYAAQEWRVFPCQGKRPPPGFLWKDEASLNPERLRAWWERWPDANVAMPVPEGTVVLDVDTKHGDGLQALANLEAEHGELPATRRARTGGGGLHIWWRLPAGVAHGNARGQLDRRYFDVRGAGGYVIAPPSIHPETGISYAWDKDHGGADAPIAEIPAWLLGLMQAKRGAERAPRPTVPSDEDRALLLRRASAYLATMPEAISGQGGHDACYAAACALVRGFGLDDGETFALLASEFNPKCKPPWSDKELRHKIKSAAVKSTRPHGYLLVGRPEWQTQQGTNLPPAWETKVSELPDEVPPWPTEDERGHERDDDDGEGEEQGERDLPQIVITDRQLRALVEDAWGAVSMANQPVPTLFTRGGLLVQIAHDERDGPQVRSMGVDSTHGHLARVADWVRVAAGKDGPRTFNAVPPKDVARDLLVYPHADLPRLQSVAFAPLFDEHGGLVATDGYHRAARTWLHTRGMQTPDVPEEPTSSDVDAARDLIFEVFCDFPFADEADRAAAVALLLCPFVRQLIDGPTPLHLIEASSPGSGKGLLAEVVYEVACGVQAEPAALPMDEESTRKTLTSILARAQPIVMLDNASDRLRLDSPSLAAVLTSTRWTDRELGASRMITVPNHAVWILTVNNPRMSLELARRCIRIRLAPQQDRPWQREGFMHDPLLEWVAAERPRLVWACLVLVRHWLAVGRPPGRQRLGSFDLWARKIGGILKASGIEGFLANLEEIYEAADTEGNAWREFVTAWADRHGEQWCSAGDLRRLATDRDMLLSVIGEKSERSQQSRLGRALRKVQDRIFCEQQILCVKDMHTKGMRYRLRVMEGGAQPASDSPPETWSEVEI